MCEVGKKEVVGWGGGGGRLLQKVRKHIQTNLRQSVFPNVAQCVRMGRRKWWGGGEVAPESAQTHSDNQIARNEVY